MDRWRNRIAVVTGASQGLGLAIATELIKYGITVIGLARGEDKLKETSERLNGQYPNKFHGRKCNLREESDITNTFEWIGKNFGPVSVLVNNAGIYEEKTILESTYESMRRVLETNLMAGVICSKMAVQSMIDNSIDGHIINIGSVGGHPMMKHAWENVPPIHAVAKYGVRLVTQALHRELVQKNAKIKTTTIIPGVIGTEMLVGIDIKKFGENMVPLKPQEVAEACITALSTPPNVQILELIVTPIGEM